jgi:hypothetical protein
MRYLSVAFLALVTVSALSQVQSDSSSTSLMAALQKLPSLTANNTDDILAFSRTVGSHLSDSSTEIESAFPLLRQYLKSPNAEIRRITLLTIAALEQRPNSASEFSSLLPALYPHLGVQELYLRQGALIAIASLRPGPPPEALTSIADALANTNTSDGFGADLAGTLVIFSPNSEETQSAVLTYLHRPDLTDGARADAIDKIGSPTLGERITQYIIDLAKNTPPSRLRNASIEACAKIGPRAASQITAVLNAIQANSTETPESHAAASRALAVLNHQ